MQARRLCRVTLPALTRDRVPPLPPGVGGTLPAHHASVAASPAQSPKIMATETLTARAFADERATVTSEAASALVSKAPIRKSRTLARAAPDVRSAARYQPRPDASERGSYERQRLLRWSGLLTALGRDLAQERPESRHISDARPTRA